MAKLKGNKVINGTFGSVYVNGDLWLDVESVEAKVTANFEDVNFAGDLATHKKMTGWAGEGTLTMKKIYSRGAALIGNAIKSGIVPDITLVTVLDDPDAYGAERASISEVTFSEFTLAKFEQKTIGTEELPFAFADYDLIDIISA